jgi:hypothetical protein
LSSLLANSKPIGEVPFPAITVCPSTDGKWMAIAKALKNLSTTKQINELMKTLPVEFKNIYY